MTRWTGLLLLAASCGFTQTFEVAAIKPLSSFTPAPPGTTYGRQPGGLRFEVHASNLRGLISYAYFHGGK